MARFTLPRDIYHGKGTLEILRQLKGSKAMVCVGGGSMKKFGFLDRAVGYLKEAGFTHIRVYGDRRMEAPTEGEQRIYIKARQGKIK